MKKLFVLLLVVLAACNCRKNMVRIGPAIDKRYTVKPIAYYVTISNGVKQSEYEISEDWYNNIKIGDTLKF